MVAAGGLRRRDDAAVAGDRRYDCWRADPAEREAGRKERRAGLRAPRAPTGAGQTGCAEACNKILCKSKLNTKNFPLSLSVGQLS